MGSLSLAFDEVQRLDQFLSNYRPASEWSQVNRFAAERPVKVSKELFDLLALASNTAAKAMERSTSRRTADEGLGVLQRHRAICRIGRRFEARWRRWATESLFWMPRRIPCVFARPGVEIDPGGIGKGYAVDRMVADPEDSMESIPRLVVGGGQQHLRYWRAAGRARAGQVSIRDPQDRE